MEDRCECVSCSDVEDGDARTEMCEKCQGIMGNTRVVCYGGNANGIPQQWVTECGDAWTANHGWSQCQNCHNIGGYIT